MWTAGLRNTLRGSERTALDELTMTVPSPMPAGTVDEKHISAASLRLAEPQTPLVLPQDVATFYGPAVARTWAGDTASCKAFPIERERCHSTCSSSTGQS